MTETMTDEKEYVISEEPPPVELLTGKRASELAHYQADEFNTSTHATSMQVWATGNYLSIVKQACNTELIASALAIVALVLFTGLPFYLAAGSLVLVFLGFAYSECLDEWLDRLDAKDQTDRYKPTAHKWILAFLRWSQIGLAVAAWVIEKL